MKRLAPPIVAALAVIATAGFSEVFLSWSFLLAAVSAAVGATVVGLFGRHLGLGPGERLALSVVAFAAVGVAVIGSDFAGGVVYGWADLLTSSTPTDPAPRFLALPFTLAWLGAMIGCELIHVRRLPALGVIGPLSGLALALLFTLHDPTIAAAQGASMVAGALLLDRVGGADVAARWAVVVAGVGLTAVIAVAGAVVGPRLPGVESNERLDLRDHLTPPWDPLDTPSPLVELKSSLKESRQDTLVFTITGDAPVLRWQVAVLEAYDGTVWAVADSQHHAPSQFRPIDSTFPDDGRGPGRTTELTHTIEIADLGGVWLPAGGWPVAFEADPDHPEIRFNPATGTIAAPDGLTAGIRYQLTSAPAPELGLADLVEAGVTPLTNDAGLSLVSPVVAAVAADLTEGASPGWEQVRAIEAKLRTEGFYDRSSKTRPGHSAFRLNEFLADPDRLVAYEEQYAAAAGVLTRLNGLSSRVVVGYLLPDTRWQNGAAEVKAGDVSAWIEVDVPGAGWVPVDVTPDRTREPSDQEAGISTVDVAVPNPPPDLPPPDTPPVFDQRQEEAENGDGADDERTTGGGLNPTVVAAGAAMGIPTTAILVGALLVIGLKARRRKRRRRATDPATRVAGAWYEVADRWQEAGVERAPGGTAREVAAGWLLTQAPERRNREVLDELITQVDRAAFHPDRPDRADAEAAWDLSDRIHAGLRAEQPFLRRCRHRLDPRPLRRTP
ncbi:MAG: transglutaminase domain-containing protein [Actinomycetia bacterium]|nr:transglutaminase domain-containing protein [Actinomycetes bacterium]